MRNVLSTFTDGSGVILEHGKICNVKTIFFFYLQALRVQSSVLCFPADTRRSMTPPIVNRGVW